MSKNPNHKCIVASDTCKLKPSWMIPSGPHVRLYYHGHLIQTNCLERVWECSHPHKSRDEAVACAQRTLDRWLVAGRSL